MFKKFLSMTLAIVLTLSFVAVLAACQPEVVEATGEFSYEDYDTVDNENYNKNLYYLNELKQRNIPTYIISAIFRPKQIFFRAGRGELEANPFLFARGDWPSIYERRKKIELKISYDTNGRTVQTKVMDDEC